MEIWKEIEGFGGCYFISNYGNVKSIGKTVHDSIGRTRIHPPRMFKKNLNNTGYYRVNLGHLNKDNLFNIHVLVCRYFVPEIKGKNHVNHKDGNKLNNHFSNLEWCTHKENMKHAFKTGLVNNTGENHGYSKLKDEDIFKIRSLEGKHTHKEISKMFGVSREQIGVIIRKQQWKHLI